jgi:hypothetical protein
MDRSVLRPVLRSALRSGLREHARPLGTLALALVAGAALAITPASFADDDADSLAGPKVKDSSVPGQPGRFAGGIRGEKGENRERVQAMAQARLFPRAIESLRTDAPEAIRLSEDQDAQVQSILGAFRASMDDYKAQHKDEVLALREQLTPRDRQRVDAFLRSGPAGGPNAGAQGPGAEARKGEGKGKRPAKGDWSKGDKSAASDDMMSEVDPAKAEVARTRLVEIVEGAPQPAESQAKVLAILSEDQKKFVQAEVDRLSKEARERMDDRRGDRADRPDGAAGPDREAIRAKIEQSLSPEEKEKLKAMSPEDRREFLREKARALREQGNAEKK